MDESSFLLFGVVDKELEVVLAVRGTFPNINGFGSTVEEGFLVEG